MSHLEGLQQGDTLSQVIFITALTEIFKGYLDTHMCLKRIFHMKEVHVITSNFQSGTGRNRQEQTLMLFWRNFISERDGFR